MLQRGESVSEELSVKILEERLQSTEVSHYGTFPSNCNPQVRFDLLGQSCSQKMNFAYIF